MTLGFLVQGQPATQGANRSAALVTLVICSLTRQRAADVIELLQAMRPIVWVDPDLWCVIDDLAREVHFVFVGRCFPVRYRDGFSTALRK